MQRVRLVVQGFQDLPYQAGAEGLKGGVLFGGICELVPRENHVYPGCETRESREAEREAERAGAEEPGEERWNGGQFKVRTRKSDALPVLGPCCRSHRYTTDVPSTFPAFILTSLRVAPHHLTRKHRLTCGKEPKHSQLGCPT